MEKKLNTSLLKEYVNNWNIPIRASTFEEDNNEQSWPDDGDGLSHFGEYAFMCLGLVPNDKVDSIFEKIAKKVEVGRGDSAFLSIHNIPDNETEKLLLVIHSADDSLISYASSLMKNTNHLKYSDEFNIYPEGFGDNDGGLERMNYDLTLAVLKCQNFFKKAEMSSLKDQKICFTGFRDKNLEKILTDLGAKIVNSVTKETTFLVALNAFEFSSKTDKAKKFNIPVINMFDLITKKIMVGCV